MGPTTSSQPLARSTVPATSAAPVSQALGDREALVKLASDVAMDLEGWRRAITLSGSLLWIPAAGGAVLALSAVVGVRGVWLFLCTLAGLAAGPALTTASIALLSLVGLPAVRSRYRRRARGLGLTRDEVEEAWRRATLALDAEVRERLGRKEKAEAT